MLQKYGLAAVAAAAHRNRFFGPRRADCPVKLGAILPVSGPMGQVGERIAETGLFAVEQFNEAGGVLGCPVEYVLRDTQGQSAVGVDAAKSLVDLDGVQALIGAVSSGVSLPVLTSVAVPSKVVQVSCCSSSESFTALAEEGKTEGYWFRTYATNRSQSAIGAKLTVDSGFKNTAVIYVNTDFGVGLAKRFEQDIAKLGGSISVDGGLQREPAKLSCGGHEGAGGQSGFALPRGLSRWTAPRSPANGWPLAAPTT